MSRIRILPPELANQIAAGEVIERPASVVKELVENAIDAGARRVEVEVEGGGRRLIRVVDDGCGMTLDEARLALERHATSKLASADDLFRLTTLGFRGEALPSIAAVARFTLTTRPPEALAGARIEVEAGLEREAREAGCAPGTRIEVRDLLFNVPARLKFLKSEPTEAAQITEAVLRLGLAHPSLHLALRHGGRLALELPPHVSERERVQAALGKKGRAPLVLASGTGDGVAVRAYLGRPEESQPTARGVYLFVNRRFIRDRALLHALVAGYGELLDRGRYPEAVLFLELEGARVDVNVHPQKQEVRFSQPDAVHAAVRRTVRDAIARAPWLPKGREGAGERLFTDVTPALPLRLAEPAQPYLLGAHASPALGFAPPPETASGVALDAAPSATSGAAPLAERARDSGAAVMPAPQPRSEDHGVQSRERSGELRRVETAAGTERGAAVAEAPSYFSSLEYLGQLHRLYLVCQAPGELVLIDQHAAHERVAFERIRRGHASRSARGQRLLFPVTIEPGADLVAAAGEAAELLEGCGLEVEPFGPRALVIKAVPEPLGGCDPGPLVRDVLAEIAEGGGARSVIERLDHLFATMACHSVTRAGDALTPAEARALLASMDGVDRRANCPHGRPVLLRMRMEELGRRFERT